MVARDPWRELFALPHELSHFLNDVSIGSDSAGRAPAVYLPLDIRQTETEFVLEASVPGFNPDEIEVVSEQGTLTIRGERKTETRPEGRYLRRERRQLSFFRQLALPQDVRDSEISAQFVNGVLTLRIPRVEAAGARRIKIEVSTSNQALETAPVTAESVALPTQS